MSTELYDRYAVALKDVAIEENIVEEIRLNLLQISEALSKEEDFLKLLASYSLDGATKNKIIDEVFSSTNEYLKTFVKIIVENNRAIYLLNIINRTIELLNDYLDIEEGIIYTTIPFKEEEISRIKESIEKKINKTISLKNVIDKNLIGGFKVVLKNHVFDASIKNDLEKISAMLSKGEN